MRFRSWRTKLQSALLLLGLAGIGLTVWEASDGATRALRAATEDRLIAIRQTRARQIERYFEDVGKHVLALSNDESAISALEQFQSSWDSVSPASSNQTDLVRKFYDSAFAELAAKEPSGPGILARWFPGDGRVRRLQHTWIAANPYPPGAKYRLLSAPELQPYNSAHSRYHPTLQRYASAFGFYDIFLIDGESGRILYSVLKEVDLGVALTDAPYSTTTLASVWKRAMALPEPEMWVLEDYAPYLPSHLAPAAFAAAPIYRAGTRIGVLAVQVPIAEINRAMTADRRWAEAGMGSTGEAYIVGSDGMLRSDLRREIERPSEFFRELGEAGIPDSTVERVRRFGTAVLNVKMEPLQGRRDVIRSEAALRIQGLAWKVVAEIEAWEAFQPVSALRWRMLWQAALIAVLLFAAARFLADAVTRPVLRLAAGARRLGRGDFSVRLPVESGDEIGQLAQSFNSMAADLRETTVSREELDRILNSLINAVLVLTVDRGVAPADIAAAPVLNANAAALRMLDYDGGLTGLPFSHLTGGERELWAGRIFPRLAAGGRVEAVEAWLKKRQGGEIPVLFSASWLAEEEGKQSGLVCVAQDISEWKQTQEKLRDLTERLIDAQEEERRRIGRELHDDLTQRLAAVSIDAGMLRRSFPAEDEKSIRLANRIRQEMAALSRDIHGLSHSLHPAVLEDLGLADAIESEARAFFERGGPPVDVTAIGSFSDLPPGNQLGLYRIVQEALRNARKHSGADEVRVSLSREVDRVHLSVADNGRGFDPDAPGISGVGLASIEERVRLMRGELEVRSGPGRGTCIRISIPVGANDEKAQDSAG